MTKEQNEAFEKRTELLMRVALEVYNTLAKYHRNLETIYASAIQNNGVSETSFDSVESCFTEAMECIPELRKRVKTELAELKDTEEYKTILRRINTYSDYVKALHLALYIEPDDEYLYRGAYTATFQDKPEMSEIDTWKSEMSKLLTEWNYWQTSLAYTHGYPERILVGRDKSYHILESYATKVMQHYHSLEYSEDTAEALQWASESIKRLNHNNIELMLSSIYEKNYFKNNDKEGNKNEDIRNDQ